MTLIDRRRFLSLTSGSLVFLANIPQSRLLAQSLRPSEKPVNPTCWLDVCAPLVIQDRELGIDSDLVLTSDNFIGAKGYADDLDGTEYEIFLFQPDGKPIGPYGIAKRLTVPAMHTTVIPVSELVGNSSFWGGMKIRLRPKTRTPTHVSDLFSSAFVRWRTTRSFANVHANPDPLEWQRADAFFYSMPFPPLQDYDCFYSVFNPYSQKSSGEVVLYDHSGRRLAEVPYDLQPCSSILIDLSNAEAVNGIKAMFDRDRSHHSKKSYSSNGGSLTVTNHSGSVKNFGYLLMKQHNSERFSVEHPIHQPPFNPLPSRPAFDAAGRFAAKNILYTPLVFRSKRIGGVTLASRFHLSSGAPMEEYLWLRPFIVNSEGEVVWQVVQNASLHPTISHNQVERESIKLGARQSCVFDCDKVELPKNFSGGLGLAITPNSNHTLMKVEILVKEWGASAFTHFRPGLKSARSYQSQEHRGTLTTDYIASGARLEFKGGTIIRDEIIGVISIDEKKSAGGPSLEIFDSKGFATRVKLDAAPAFSCRHYLLSELVSGKIPSSDLTLRLVDETATLLMSILHLDYGRRDIAADHGSDRFSTFGEFTCQTKT